MTAMKASEILSSSEHVWCDLGEPNASLAISFAGNLGQEDPQPEFGGILARLRVNKVLTVDPRRLWYLAGIEGLGTVDEVATQFRQLREELRCRRVICCGNSSGGFAAILFGVLIGAEQVLAISPQVDLSDFDNLRVPANRARMRRAPDLAARYRDLRGVVAAGRGRTRISIHYAALNRWDRFHCRRLEGLPGVESFGYLWPSHGLVYPLRQRGDLLRIVEAAVDNREHRASRLFGPRAIAADFARKRRRRNLV